MACFLSLYVRDGSAECLLSLADQWIVRNIRRSDGLVLALGGGLILYRWARFGFNKFDLDIRPADLADQIADLAELVLRTSAKVA